MKLLSKVIFPILLFFSVAVSAESTVQKNRAATVDEIEKILQPYKKLFDLSTQRLSPKLKQFAWQSIIKEMRDNAFRVDDDPYFVSNMSIIFPFENKNHKYNGALALSVDANDIESAEWYCQLMLKYHGVKKEFKYTGDEGVWHVMYSFNKWVKRHASHLTVLAINTYGSEYEAMLVDNKVKDDVLKEFKKLNIVVGDLSPQGEY